MARKSTTKVQKKVCSSCNRELTLNNYYNSDSPMFPEGKVNICKKCIGELIDYSDMESIYMVLRSLDLPFFAGYWRTSEEKNPDNPFGMYIRMANSKLNQFKNARWKDSIFETEPEDEKKEKASFIDDADLELFNSFKPTREMLIRWGTKYEPEQYIKLENFYQEMKLKNNIETPQEEDYLKKLATISLKFDEEMEAGNYSQAKALGDLFSKYMADSKFRAMDKTEADKTGGIRSFSVIFAEVESDGFIPPWEQYRKMRNVNQDLVDRTIMHLENFILRLNKVEKMNEPPIDTPTLEQEDTTLDLGGI